MPGPYSSPVLDDFNRANGAPGSNWTADIRDFGIALPSIASNQLARNADFNDGWWNPTTFHAYQEVFCTISAMPNNGAMRLMARVQGMKAR